EKHVCSPQILLFGSGAGRNVTIGMVEYGDMEGGVLASESESESESEWDLLASRFTPTWMFFWCEGAYSKHKTKKHRNTISTTHNIKSQISTTHKKSTT